MISSKSSKVEISSLLCNDYHSNQEMMFANEFMWNPMNIGGGNSGGSSPTSPCGVTKRTRKRNSAKRNSEIENFQRHWRIPQKGESVLKPQSSIADTIIHSPQHNSSKSPALADESKVIVFSTRTPSKMKEYSVANYLSNYDFSTEFLMTFEIQPQSPTPPSTPQPKENPHSNLQVFQMPTPQTVRLH
eukprot:TRINITY_DN8428_c0_g1_i1.p1 TRINITY_DN8428_c0_g1~~TRINITY_DN8428_c0_g1_i1.p1  ORF type:complete len:188 (+),score=32.57 TRINITY_DN8428_c0_g1_i1:60-623(+)